jgi:hypothetical protein
LLFFSGCLLALGLRQISGSAETAVYNGASQWANYWTRTITELRDDLLSSSKLNDALVDAFLSYCADSNWWTQTIAFTAVHARAPEAESNLGTGAGGCDFASIE